MSAFNHRGGKSLPVDGAKIYYESCGTQNRPPLLLLHGGFGNMEDFNKLLPSLSRDFTVIGIDSRGHGKSTLGPRTLTYEQLQADVCRVLDHLSIETASIIGFSDGGVVAYRLASKMPRRVDKLVAIGASCRLTDATRQILAKVTAESWKAKFPATYDAYQKHNPEPDFDAFSRSTVEMWLDPETSGYPNERVRAIACPVLIVRGDDDHLFSLAEAVELRGMIAASKLLNIPSAGHVAFDDQESICSIAIRQFLSPDTTI